jgi:hypothetical protein
VAQVSQVIRRILSPQAKALLRPPPNPYKPEDNIYIAIAGFDAPPGESVTAAGVAKVDYCLISTSTLFCVIHGRRRNRRP